MTGTWIGGITAAAVISALALTLAPRGPGYNAGKLACGAMTVIMLIMPLKGFDIKRYAAFSAQQRYTGERIAESAEEDSLAVKRIIIQGQARAYILDKAAELGIEDADAEVEIAVQINGKVKATITIDKNADKDSAIAAGKDALGDKLTGTIVKEIYVPGKIVNIVVKG